MEEKEDGGRKTERKQTKCPNAGVAVHRGQLARSGHTSFLSLLRSSEPLKKASYIRKHVFFSFSDRQFPRISTFPPSLSPSL
jgi:hypothetical protein